MTKWYKDGLRFSCTGCGKCCTGGPGYAFVTDEEIEQMAEYLKISPEDFCRRYVRFAQGQYALLEKWPHYDCIFLKDNQCQVYPVRPKQCRTFPFWDSSLESPTTWEETAQHCEGIQKDGRLYSIGEIEAINQGDADASEME